MMLKTALSWLPTVAFAAATMCCALAHAQEPRAAVRAVPSALLSIDQNRATVVDRIVAEWGAELANTNAGLSPGHLRELLMAMRSDYLLAASVAGSLEGLRNVISSSLASARPAHAMMHKALGDSADDLVYTPVTPCRILDTRGASGGVLGAGQVRDWSAALPGGSFLAQGGSPTDCGIPVKPAAVVANVTVFNTTAGPAFLVAWPSGQARPAAATLNWTGAGAQVANAVILPLCTFCGFDFSTYATSQTDMVVDVTGYFAAPVATALQCNDVFGTPATIPVSADGFAGAPACGQGYVRTMVQCTGPANRPSAYLLEVNAFGCVFRNLSAASAYQATASSTCCRIPGR